MTTDESDKMAVMNAWLDAVCAELGVGRSVMDANMTGLLDLIRDVAHGPSRPGAPMTAFLVGLASATASTDPDVKARAVAERVEAVNRLVAGWPATATSSDR
ncbi:DUF6457 domain-containing protein [Cellulomonas sp.]|uniref:DUF6457 domain-containing protein n=1 Tax=Cellulomonas sp. TaxID=40001 RepID=UPI0025C382C0|nr:DUF6457 domain-containing protein [Cellulomonas sp.]